ncbi:MAG: WYL domain-containing protein [Campylobacteraceae bacterium]|nr:WYL domain-containing protein [Campylobacteraceae bacterium]
MKNIHSFRLEAWNFEPNFDGLYRLEKALNVWFEPNSELFEVRLLVRSTIAKYFERRAMSITQKIIATRPNGDVEMSVLVSSEKEALYEIKKWIPDIAVISPKSLVLQMKNIASEFLNNQLDVLLN